MRLPEWFESLRKWIDGEEDLDEKGQPRPRSKWEDFLVAIAREVEQCMQREMFTPPGGPTYIPREYVVFLSPADDADWQGEKREGLERGLHHVLSERASELVGAAEFQTRTFTVELRVDAVLEPGRFRVQHVWDSQSQKTMVTPRKRGESATPGPKSPETTVGQPEAGAAPASESPQTTVGKPQVGAPPASQSPETTVGKPQVGATPASKSPQTTVGQPQVGAPPILESPETAVGQSEATPASKSLETAVGQRDEDATIVRPRKREVVFSVSVRRNLSGVETVPPEMRSFFKDEITVGRGSRQVVVDLKLEGDLEISRKHATIKKTGEGDYTITCHGANAIALDGGREVPTGATAKVKPGEQIEICSYELTIVSDE